MGENRNLSLKEAIVLLRELEQKIPLVRGIRGTVRLGIAARSVEGRERLYRSGYLVFTISSKEVQVVRPQTGT